MTAMKVLLWRWGDRGVFRAVAPGGAPRAGGPPSPPPPASPPFWVAGGPRRPGRGPSMPPARRLPPYSDGRWSLADRRVPPRRLDVRDEAAEVAGELLDLARGEAREDDIAAGRDDGGQAVVGDLARRRQAYDGG